MITLPYSITIVLFFARYLTTHGKSQSVGIGLRSTPTNVYREFGITLLSLCPTVKEMRLSEKCVDTYQES